MLESWRNGIGDEERGRSNAIGAGKEHKRLTVRTAFSRDFKKRGMIPLSTYLKQYKVGDIVDVVCNGAVQKGMP